MSKKERDRRRAMFHEATAYYRSRGYEVLNPCELDHPGDPPSEISDNWMWYILRDLKAMWIFNPTDIAFLPGSLFSFGVMIERIVAKKLRCVEHRYKARNS